MDPKDKEYEHKEEQDRVEDSESKVCELCLNKADISTIHAKC